MLMEYPNKGGAGWTGGSKRDLNNRHIFIFVRKTELETEFGGEKCRKMERNLFI